MKKIVPELDEAHKFHLSRFVPNSFVGSYQAYYQNFWSQALEFCTINAYSTYRTGENMYGGLTRLTAILKSSACRNETTTIQATVNVSRSVFRRRPRFCHGAHDDTAQLLPGFFFRPLSLFSMSYYNLLFSHELNHRSM